MRRRGPLIAICVGLAAIATGTFYFNRSHQLAPVTATSAQASAPPDAIAPELKHYIDRMASFDAAAYAKQAIRAHDYRHVVTLGESSYEDTPGIRCIANRNDTRYIAFVHGRHSQDEQLDKTIVAAARDFNAALTSAAEYPDKDVCFPITKKLRSPDAARIAAEPARRPRIVNLHTAVRAQDEIAAKRFIASGADINASDEWGQTPLLWAIRRANIALMNDLFDAGARVDQVTGVFEDATATAVETGNADVLRTLLKAVRSKGLPPDKSNSALDVAVGLERLDLLDILISFDEIPSADDIEAWRVAFDTATMRKCVPCLMALLAATTHTPGRAGLIQDLVSAQIDRKPAPTFIPLVRAALDDVSYSSASRQALEAASGHRKVSAVVYLLRHSQNANLLTPQEIDQLRGAAMNGQEPAMEKLLAEATRRRVALDTAIRSNDLEGIRAAVPAGAALAQTYTFTPLMLAAIGSDASTIDSLISLGAEPSATAGGTHYGYWTLLSPGDTSDDGATPLYYAVKHANLDAARALVRRGASLDARSGGRPLLAELGSSWDDDKVPLSRQRAFVDWVLQLSRKSDRQRRADLMLAAAAQWGHRDLARTLLKEGANPCATVDDYPQAVVGYSDDADLALLKVLINECKGWSNKSQVARDTLRNALSLIRKWTPASREVVRYLLSQRIPLPPPEYGATVLDDAVASRNLELMELLLDAGADINELSQERTALDWAQASLDNDRTIEFLRARGAKTAAELGVKLPEEQFPF